MGVGHVDVREIKDLLRYVRSAEFQEFELEVEGLRLRVIRGGTNHVTITQTSAAASPAGPAAVAGNGALPAAEVPATPAAAEPGKAEDLYEQTSPMVGTFYRAPRPGADPFISVGMHVGTGQTLCIIEAMKLMNEIEAEVPGTIVEILPENAQPVEFGEVLFRIRPDR
ncbi:MAG: acetyl-CoA carboxylase biotin carboxyl carrier protein [Acidobacteria bacterium]|nr:acetyl-CoA carboxylase biotin carboxyl carrier protein [Acidobacteriota bacterium]